MKLSPRKRKRFSLRRVVASTGALLAIVGTGCQSKLQGDVVTPPDDSLVNEDTTEYDTLIELGGVLPLILPDEEIQ